MAEKNRIYTGVIYPDSESYNYTDVLNSLNYFMEWAWALHDKDIQEDGTPKKPHIHWVGRLSGAVRISAVALAMGLQEHEIEIGRNFKNLIQYLIHQNDSDKYQYSVDIINSNIADISKYLRQQTEGEIVLELCEMSLNSTWYDLIRWANDNGCYDVFRRNVGTLKLVRDELLNFNNQ